MKLRKPSPELSAWFKRSIEETRKRGSTNGRLLGLANNPNVGIVNAMAQSVMKDYTSGRDKAVDLDMVEWSLEAGVIKFASEFTELEVAYARVNYDQMTKKAA